MSNAGVISLTVLLAVCLKILASVKFFAVSLAGTERDTGIDYLSLEPYDLFGSVRECCMLLLSAAWYREVHGCFSTKYLEDSTQIFWCSVRAWDYAQME